MKLNTLVPLFLALLASQMIWIGAAMTIFLKDSGWGLLSAAGFAAMLASGIRACCAAYEDRP